jgi:hypothetical protein
MTTFIYILVDPRNDHVRYVGKSNNPIGRYSSHIACRYKTHSRNWIKSLLNVGQKPNN